ncbi:HNH endonuclease signature motif containing protein [Agromyces bracchium]|nr:HNH endonuclease signature motif containing protein [Agromyces bracchium]
MNPTGAPTLEWLPSAVEGAIGTSSSRSDVLQADVRSPDPHGAEVHDPEVRHADLRGADPHGAEIRGAAPTGREIDALIDECFLDVRREPAASVHLSPEAADLRALADDLGLLVSLEQTIRWAQAEQFRLVESARARHARVEGVTDDSGRAARDGATRSFVAELATTLVVPEPVAGGLVADDSRLTGPRAATLDALEAGEIAIGHVRAMLELTRVLPSETADEVERSALADAATRTTTGFRRRLRRLCERLHPEPLEARRTRAAEERRVVLEPAPDGMAWLSLFVEAERAVAIVARLDALAAWGDPERRDERTRAQRRADVAGDLLLAGTLDASDRHLAAATGRVAAHVTVTVPVLSLLGLDDEPADLDGYGPIDAETARILAAHAPSLRRLLVHPETGAALSYGRATYRVPADLAGYVRVRDGTCRFPGCNRRAQVADLDHSEAWEHGGETSADNLAALCPPHHWLKHQTGWRLIHEADGAIRWTSPAGHVLRTLPERPFIPVAPSTVGARPPRRSGDAGSAPPSDGSPPGRPEPRRDASGPGRSGSILPDEPPWWHGG